MVFVLKVFSIWHKQEIGCQITSHHLADIIGEAKGDPKERGVTYLGLWGQVKLLWGSGLSKETVLYSL